MTGAYSMPPPGEERHARRQIAGWMDIHRVERERAKEVQEAVTKLALRYNLMSSFTSST